jgi:acetyl-CoA C-acetyltransferase
MSHAAPEDAPGRGAPEEAVFIGVGELESGRFPDRPFMQALVDVSIDAVRDAELSVSDIDSVVLIPCLHSADDQADLIFSRVIEELGLHGRAKANMMVHSGGSTSDNAVRVAAGLIHSGEARNVLVAQADKWGSAPVAEMVDMLSGYGIPREWERPTGLTFNAIGALITQRYMASSGSTAEEMAAVCVALREWAQLNPRAMYRDRKLTVEQIINSKMVTDPLHAYECPMLSDGATAFVMTSTESARAASRESYVRIAGSGGCVAHYSIGQDADLGVLGWPQASVEAYERAGWGPQDADLANVYDSYAAVLTIGLEGLGISPKDESARLFASGAYSPGGQLPVNTNGGLLSAGHTGVGGGTALLVEAVRQLLHRAEWERQVPDAERAIVGGTGGSYMDSQVMLLERVS